MGSMVWILLFVNVATLIIAARKRVLPYALFTAIFLVLVIGQAFQIQQDFHESSILQYAYSTMSEWGFERAMWYCLGVSLLSLVFSTAARGYQVGRQPQPKSEFCPSLGFYAVLFAILCGTGGFLIFKVVGLSAFLTKSRPGNQPGATLFITLLGIGTFPILLKFICKSRIRSWDIACFLLALLLTGGFSRIHVILYVLTLSICLYYSGGWADRRLGWKRVLSFLGIGFALVVFFFAAGAIRGAESFTSGSITDLISYSLDHPKTSLLSLDYMYRVNIEGVSGLAGAFSQAQSDASGVRHAFGLGIGLDGIIQDMPAGLKSALRGPVEDIQGLYWYKKTAGNVSPGIEASFVSFGWAGIFVYSVMFFLFGWVFPVEMVRMRLSPMLRLCSYLYLGCGVFFIRGSWADWIAFSIAYSIIVVVAWPLFWFQIKRRELNESGAVPPPVRGQIAPRAAQTIEGRL